MAYIKIESTTTTTISVCLAGLDTQYSRNDRICTWYVNGRDRGSTSLRAYASSGAGSIFVELDPGTAYEIMAVVTAPDWTTPVVFTETAETDEAPTVQPWSWTSSNGSASDSQTRRAYEAITSRGKTSDFSYLVWNDMVDKVKEIQTSRECIWNDGYATYSDTKMSVSDRKLTAKRFNSLLRNIDRYYDTEMSYVARWEPIYGSYFISLTELMNEWIGEG